MSKKNELNPTLFTLINSKIFLELVRIINQIKETGKSLTYNEVLKLLQDVYGDDITAQEHKLFPEVLNCYFGITKEKIKKNRRWRDDIVELPINTSIPIRATNRELRWLKSMLQDQNSDFLLSDELRQKILDNINKNFSIAGIEYVDDFDDKDFWSPTYIRPESTQTPEFRKKLETVWKAIVTHHKIRYKNVTPNGIHQGIEAPCRLEFDCAYGTYNLIIWPNREKRPVKMRVDRLETVELTDDQFDEYIINEAFRKSLDEKKEVARLQLLDVEKTNSLHRFYTRFEGYDKDSHQDPDNKDLYHIDLHYYSFDSNDVLHGLMSLGPFVRVLSPKTLCDEIKTKYQTAYSRQQTLQNN